MRLSFFANTAESPREDLGLSMIVLPLGLGTKLKRAPLVTVMICLVWIVAELTDRSDLRIYDGIFNVASETGVRDRARDLFVDYCQSRKGTAADCGKYAVLIWTGYPAKGELSSGAVAKTMAVDSGSETEAEKRFYSRMDAEHTVADKLRKSLLDCQEERRCFIYKDIVWRFLDHSHQHYKVFAGLKSYLPYTRAMQSYRFGLKGVCAENDCLVRNNITPVSLLEAQVRHGGFFHLFGNMLMFIVFGAYAEQRTRRLVYLATVVLGGTLGMAVHAAFFSSGDTIALGGSANVSAAMGMFFVFFYRQNMRFLVWLPRKVYFGTAFPAPVAYAFPLVFVLSDVIGGLDSGFGNLAAAGVAHFAHLTGFIFGALIAAIITRVKPLPLPFIYEDELRDMQALEQARDPALALTIATGMIRYNPDNVHALEVGCAQFLRWAAAVQPNENAALLDRGRHFLITHLQTVCAVNARKNDLFYACRLLSQLPLYMNYPVYLGNLGQVPALKLGDFALLKGHPILALRLYDFFLTRYGVSHKRPQVEATILHTLSCLPASRENVGALLAFTQTHPQSTLGEPIAAWLREKQAA